MSKRGSAYRASDISDILFLLRDSALAISFFVAAQSSLESTAVPAISDSFPLRMFRFITIEKLSPDALRRRPPPVSVDPGTY